MATYVLVHGSFWGSWAWTDLARLLRATGHDVYAPSLTGLGERVHLASPEITLDTHVLDVSGTLTYEELQEVVLVGHSYGGMVLTGVAERLPERIAHLVFLDASVPSDGESLSSMMGPEWTELVLEVARTQGDGWRFGSRRADMGDLSPQEQSWYGRATPQPIQTWLQPLAVRNPAAAAIPRTYILCSDRQWPSGVFFDASAAMLARCAAAARAAGWGYHELHTVHHAMLSAPQALADILLDLAPASAATPSPTAAAASR
jgi:pimeloyl-ACP methyl ester carboxylesterase